MKEFFNYWYSSNIMTLCITSNKKMGDIEKMINKYFKPISNTNVEVPDYGLCVAPYSPQNCTKLIKMVSVEDNNQMKIVWNLPYYGNIVKQIHLSYF